MIWIVDIVDMFTLCYYGMVDKAEGFDFKVVLSPFFSVRDQLIALRNLLSQAGSQINP